jgi:hypothetical protein
VICDITSLVTLIAGIFGQSIGECQGAAGMCALARELETRRSVPAATDLCQGHRPPNNRGLQLLGWHSSQSFQKSKILPHLQSWAVTGGSYYEIKSIRWRNQLPILA